MRRFFLGLAVAALVVGAGLLVVKAPDFGQIGAFFSGQNLTWTAVTAVTGLIIWVVLIGLAGGMLVAAIKGVEARQRDPHQKSPEAILLLAAGLIVLGVGMAHHFGGSPQQCCGVLQEAAANANP